ncbi:MAG: SPOR domain-containing protein [Flammeovirgaceae bacterium]|nr:MAG: SPOR domain-containing protein [Flammeovirgaceae bacterium]
MARRKKTDDNPPANENQASSDDTFGLPEINYEPIRRDEPATEPEPEPESEPLHESEPVAQVDEATTGETTYSEEPVAPAESEYHYEPVKEPAPVWPKVLAIVLVVVVALGAAYYFLIYQPQQEEKARQAAIKAQQDKERIEREEEENRARLAREAAEKRRLDSLAAIPTTGTIETLEQRTGKYYVVVASAVDVDLLTDYAKKLSEKGVSSKIIPPFGKHKVYRITVDSGDSFALAQAKADGLKSEYGDAVWVLRY